MCDYMSSSGVCQTPGINEISGLLFCGEHWQRVMDMPGAIRCALLDALEREKMLKETGSLGRFCEEVVVDGMTKDLEVNL